MCVVKRCYQAFVCSSTSYTAAVFVCNIFSTQDVCSTRKKTFAVKLNKPTHMKTQTHTKHQSSVRLFVSETEHSLNFSKLPLATTLCSFRKAKFLYSGRVNHCCRCRFESDRGFCGFCLPSSPAATVRTSLPHSTPVPLFFHPQLLSCGLIYASSLHISLPLFSAIMF